MSTSLNTSTVSHFRSGCSNITKNSMQAPNQLGSRESKEREFDRLTFKDIQNITKSMLKDKQAHSHNLGVIQNIKGKMYCLKLGEVAQFKEFSHYFYTSQYRRRFSKAQSTPKGIENETIIKRAIRKHTTQPQNWGEVTLHVEDNSEEIKRLHYGEKEEVQMLRVDSKLKQKISRHLLPSLPSNGESQLKERELESKLNIRNGSTRKML